MRNTQRTGGRRGFTLMEMMVAVALAVIIMAVVGVCFTQASQVSQLARARMQAMRNARVAMKFIEQDLEKAYVEPYGGIFYGVIDATGNQVDRNRDGAVGDEDPVVFDSPAGEERHALELLTMAGLPYLDDARNVYRHGASHVIYYCGPDREVDMAGEESLQTYKLIRFAWSAEDLGPDKQIGAELPGQEGDEEAQAIAFGITRFHVRYLCSGTWYESWDSMQGGSAQEGRMPERVEVILRIIDEQGRLGQEGREAVVLRRVIDVPEGG